MKTDIWHLPTDIPENGREILCMRENKWATGWGKKYTVRNAKSRINPSYDAYITKWCYLDDLLEQSSKIERLENALQDALDVIYERIGYRVDGIDELENILKKAIMENNNAE